MTIRCSFKTLIIFLSKPKKRSYTIEDHGQTNILTDMGGTAIKRKIFVEIMLNNLCLKKLSVGRETDEYVE